MSYKRRSATAKPRYPDVAGGLGNGGGFGFSPARLREEWLHLVSGSHLRPRDERGWLS